MAESFRVEPAGLSRAGGQLSVVAGQLAGVRPVGPLGQAAGAVPGAGTAAAAARLGGELTGVVGQLRAAVGAMSTAATATAANYTGADSHSASLFPPLAAALPRPTATSPLGAGPIATGPLAAVSEP